jgi:uncharacterized membrane protein YdfJ with MMPL/SSD domain
VITSAGLILAGTFGALVTSPLQLLFQVGLAVALGVLVDTFVVRSLLVPAITAFIGERAWWPFHRRGSCRRPGCVSVSRLAGDTSPATLPEWGVAHSLTSAGTLAEHQGL